MFICTYILPYKNLHVEIYHNRAVIMGLSETKTLWLFEDISDIMEQIGMPQYTKDLHLMRPTN